jgi:hypothetical protein
MITNPHYLPRLNGYTFFDYRHGGLILTTLSEAYDELWQILGSMRLYKSDIMLPGGSKSPFTKRLEAEFKARGWNKKKFEIQTEVSGKLTQSRTHEVDHFHESGIALEINWNSKDSVFDRDLSNFSRLHSLGAIELGVMITRSTELQSIFDDLGYGLGKKYGKSTTHIAKFIAKMELQGAGGGCPVLAIAINNDLYEINEVDPAIIAKLKKDFEKSQDENSDDDSNNEDAE